MAFNRETLLYEGFIYCISNMKNSKQYIGQTTRTIEERWKQHLYNSKTGRVQSYLYTAMKKYGVDHFCIKQVYKCEYASKQDVLSDLNQTEILLINKLNTLKPNGYNMAIGGDNTGNTFPEKSVFQYDNMNNIVAKYKSVSDAARQTGNQQADISNCCLKKKVNSVGGYVFAFCGESFNKDALRNTVFDQYDLSGNFIERFSDARTLIVKYPTFRKASIQSCCCSFLRSAYGYIWRYPPADRSIVLKITPSRKKSMHKGKTVIQFDNDDIKVAEFISCVHAANSIGGRADKISATCLGKKRTYLGYKWAYGSEESMCS